MLVILALVLAGIGAVALGCGLHGQARLDVAFTEARLTTLLRPLLIADDDAAVRQHVRELQADERLALSFLAVRDAAGRVLASGGAFESWPLRGVPAVQRVMVRRQMYRFTSDAGFTVIESDDAQPLGTVEFSRFKQLRADVDAAALVALRRVGLSLLVMAAGLLLWAAWRRLRPVSAPDPQVLRERLHGQICSAAAAESVDGESRSGYALLAALDVAVLRFDYEGRVLAMNEPAERWTGWRERDAQTRPLLTVLHLLDAEGEPALSTVHLLLAEPLPAVLQQSLTVLSRKAARQRVDLKVVVETRGGREGGTVLLADASRRLDRISALEGETQVMREALAQLDEAILIVTSEGAVRAAHGRAGALFGYDDREWSGLTLGKLFPVPFMQMPELSLTAFEFARDDLPTVRAWRKDAQSFPVTVCAHRLDDERGGWVVQVRDLREAGHSQQMAQRERRWFELGVDQAFVMDAQTLSFIDVSAAAKAALGYSPARWLQLSLPSIAPDLDRAAFQAWLRALREGQVEVVHYVTRHRTVDDQWVPVRVALQYLDDAIRPVFLATATRLDTVETET